MVVVESRVVEVTLVVLWDRVELELLVTLKVQEVLVDVTVSVCVCACAPVLRIAFSPLLAWSSYQGISRCKIQRPTSHFTVRPTLKHPILRRFPHIPVSMTYASRS